MKTPDPKTQTDSNVSAMRWALVATIRTVITLTIITVSTVLIMPWVGFFYLGYVGKLPTPAVFPTVDIGGITALLSLVGGQAILGKVVQAFAEKPAGIQTLADTDKQVAEAEENPINPT